LYFPTHGSNMAERCLRTARAAGVMAALALTAAGCGGGGSEAPSAAAGRPSIVLISIDTLNPASLHTYREDADPLPALDALAAGSARFREAVSPSSWTLPAHASLLTGLYPDRHGATDPRRSIAEDVRTLAEILGDAGWETVSFTDAGFVDAKFGFGRGFAVCNDRSDLQRLPAASLPREGRPSRVHGRNLFDRAIAYLEKRKVSSTPVFLFLHTYSVHDYFKVHPWATDHGVAPPEESPALYRKCIQGTAAAPEGTWPRLEALYQAEVEHADAGLGRLLRALDAAGLRRNAYIAFISDHGEGFDPEHGRIHHGGRLHRDLLHVPFFLSGPGVPAADVTGTVSLVDVVPTLLDLVGLPAPAGLDGRALGPLLRSGSPPAVSLPPVPVFAMEYHHSWVDGRRTASLVSRTDPISAAVIAGNDWFITGAGGDELYARATDPDQRRNLVETDSRSEVLRSMIEKRLRALPRTATAPVDSALQEQLRSLGYVE
jgi:arylsulfatase A-like enzyme